MRGRSVSGVAVAILLLSSLVACGGSGGAKPQDAGIGESPTPLPGGAYIATAPSDGESTDKALSPGPVPSAARGTMVSGFDANGDGFYTAAEVPLAVAALYRTYQWPDRYHVDPDTFFVPLEGALERGDQFEVGAEYTLIGIPFECAWESAWLDAFRDGDEALMAESLDQLRTIRLAGPMLDAGMKDYLADMYNRAELGDPALLQQAVDGNCQNIAWIDTTAGTPDA